MLQLLLTRTNQNKPELCRCGSVQVLCGVRWGWGVRVWQSTLFNTHKWLYVRRVRRGEEVNSNHIKTFTFQPMVMMFYSNKRILKTSQLRNKCGRQRGRVTERKTEADWGWTQVSTGFGQTRDFLHTHERTKHPGSVQVRMCLQYVLYPYLYFTYVEYLSIEKRNKP